MAIGRKTRNLGAKRSKAAIGERKVQVVTEVCKRLSRQRLPTDSGNIPYVCFRRTAHRVEKG